MIKIFVLLTICFCLIYGCGTAHKFSQESFLYVHVKNRSMHNVKVYLFKAGQNIRLGNVFASEERKFRLQEYLSNYPGELSLVAYRNANKKRGSYTEQFSFDNYHKNLYFEINSFGYFNRTR